MKVWPKQPHSSPQITLSHPSDIGAPAEGDVQQPHKICTGTSGRKKATKRPRSLSGHRYKSDLSEIIIHSKIINNISVLMFGIMSGRTKKQLHLPQTAFDSLRPPVV